VGWGGRWVERGGGGLQLCETHLPDVIALRHADEEGPAVRVHHDARRLVE
jgi:hypothetical protein